MYVVIFHNAVWADATAADRDVLVQADAVAAALVRLGHRYDYLACTLDLESARRELLERKPDVVFNLVESLGGSDWLAYLATSLLDLLDVPYTGNSTEATFLSAHKLLAKEQLHRAGLPTPEWLVLEPGKSGFPSGNTCGDSPWSAALPPWMIKSVTEHASFGLDEHSLIRPESEAALRAALAQQAAGHRGRWFAERYIDGREFNLSVLAGPDGPEVLAPAEIDFSAFPPGKPRIVGQRAKWDEDSFEYGNTPRRFEYPQSDRPLLERLTSLARDCWHAFGLGGYARVDYRVDPTGQPWILEINSNPCISPDAGFAAALAQASIPFEDAVARILQDARPRAK